MNLYLVTHRHPKSPAAEAFRTLRTSLAFASPEPVRTLLVTSAAPEEGKSTVVSNLAVVMAQAGKRVLVVDADLRKPQQHRIFEVPNHRGLTNVLVGDADIGEVVSATPVSGVDLVSSGPIPPNPAELLDSDRARSLWPALAGEYQCVLIDSPPLVAVADSVILSTQVEGVLVVVKAGVTRTDLLRESRALLEKAGARILGAILNEVRHAPRDYRYYYYYHSEQKRRPSDEE
ncbi:MAG: CpsD/CapB family tyrosine-protein kinase [Bacillota bacterium]|nr:CpsD/CapB family tyrosine-protein kinase [Bacillota bacterium]MDI7250462.1 CpsD/CapB family tyrosine-protein kinase [Bacillota bacterium]